MTFLSLPPGAASRPTIVGIGPAVDLRAVLPSSTFVNFQYAHTATGVFGWNSVSVAPDDGATVIKPNDIIAPAPGRWLRLNVAIPPGAGDLYFTLSGNYAAVPVPAFFDAPYIADVGFTINYVSLARRTAGTAGSTSVDVLKNGVSVFAAAIPTVFAAAGDYASDIGNVFVPGADVFVPGDVLEIRLNTVETFLAGPPTGPEGLRVTVARA